ncbi:MAG: glycosyltransferase family 2 protein [Clostridia bacterium]|nr:glycosyltransferase family 2 protein [Clostridia bacterium]
MLNAAAGITLYNPEIERLKSNIESAAAQVKFIYLVDNGSDNIAHIKKLAENYENLSLLENGENLGIAKALNQMSEAAFNDGFDWLLTLDQDTVIESELIKKYERYTELDKVAILTPFIDDEYEPDIIKSSIKIPYESVKRCYTSASLTLLSAWKEVGGYDEKMFIDCVDFDYCTTLIEHGYCIIRDNEAVVSHRLGHAKEVRFFMPIGRFFHIQKLKKPFYTYNHSPLRTYYYARNIKYYMYKHKDSIDLFTERRVYIQWLVLKLGFENDKLAKLKAIIKGRKDAKQMIKELK